ncbi:mitochondrial ribosomal protein S25-domain-containing protein [Globomyces pollinis-pini]|nr:mitochondrial ribosomal protein S25-domain-containing protein [Globomyces pollinis-pini]
MELYPPAPKPLKQVIPEQVGQFLPDDYRITRFNAQLENTTKNNRNQRIKQVSYTTTAPEIIYKEDIIRNTFYTQHPFELDRPRDITKNYTNLEWTSIYGSDTVKVPLSGESVIQRTLYLISPLYASKNSKGSQASRVPQKYTLEDAYKRSLYEFYEARESEEKKESVARQLAIQAAKNMMEEAQRLSEETATPLEKVEPLYFGRPKSKTFLEFERQEYKEGIEYRTLRELS